RPAVRADAAVDDVRDLDVEAQRVVRDQAGGLPHGAGDVLEPTALAADQVVVVVVAVDLVLHAAPAHGDPAYELDVGQRIEHVVDGLAGHGAQTLTDIVGDGLRIGVGCASTAASVASRGAVTRRPAARRAEVWSAA